MKSSRTRRSKKASPDGGRKPADDSRATRPRRAVVRGVSLKAAKTPAEPKRALAAPRESARPHERTPHEHTRGVREAVLPDRGASAHTRADVERLMGQMREANERLIVAAVRAQNLSDDAHTETARAQEDVDNLLNQLQSANERLAAGAAQAHAMAEEARAHEEEYRRLSNRLLTVQDAERRRLALDLHDLVGQGLAALAMHLDAIVQREKGLDTRSHEALAESRSLVEQCAREVRTFAYLLHPPLLDEAGLRSAVRWYAEGFSKRSGIHLVVDLDEIERLPQPIETALFRVVQESLTNVHRHASTTRASIRLTVKSDLVALTIQDQGHGLRSQRAHQTGMLKPETLGVGIQGMRERIRELGGTFDVEFTDKGTTVCVDVPLTADPP